jgi:two-component system sensor histidine kinase CpxA
VQIRVECRYGATGTEAVIKISDSGPGVPDEALDKLFQPFYRIDDARGRQTGGVGLGLAITERAVRLHGGTIQASNRNEGGLMIEIRLPALTAKTEIG